MKKIIRLTESELTNLISKIVKESEHEMSEASLMVDPYTLTATPKGNIKITNDETNKSYYYSMSAWYGIKWWDCKVEDFPYGTKIKLTAAGQNKTANIDKPQIKKLLQTKFGQDEIQTVLKSSDGKESQEVKFTKINT